MAGWGGKKGGWWGEKEGIRRMGYAITAMTSNGRERGDIDRCRMGPPRREQETSVARRSGARI